MERLLSSRDEDGVFAALRTTVMMRADPACGPTDIVARMFTDENRVYREQVMRLYRRVEEDYQRQILMLLALEQLLQSSPSRSAPSQ
jgi:hypothetical protein